MTSETMGVIHRSQDLDFIQGAAYQSLDMSNVPDYTQYPSHLTQEPVDLVSYPCTQWLGKPRRRGRGGGNMQGTGTSYWGRNYETGGIRIWFNENQNYGGNFGGAQNVGNTFDGVNLVVNNDTDSWQSLLATTCNNGQYNINDLLALTENPLDLNNNQLVDPHRSEPGFTTPALQVMSFMSDS
ncbi:hypothetical protein HanHA300_Chr02g0064101 [Helianthus annuus]|nr:hypothetical protein HanHA300_Chr02g0064101 [Helianthus annuus]KAJ0619549.1 hypothetical protein HanHA89_Chr02g0072541 [Helianthus annuus]KAJ0778012.1 hypothetical protein HanLR1_Chr02g0066991 [Helianthus annuus]